METVVKSVNGSVITVDSVEIVINILCKVG